MSATAAVAEAAIVHRACRAVYALRGVALVWSAVVVGIDGRSGVLPHPWAAAAVLAVLAVWTAVWAQAAERGRSWVARRGVLVDVALAGVAMAADQWAYQGPHPQSLASIWPMAAVVATGVLRGPWAGALAGAFVGASNTAAAAAVGRLDQHVLASVGTTLLLVAAGAVTGLVVRRLRRDATVVALAEAREELARELHDGVLQTLAVVQRRSGDHELVALARNQELELRALLEHGTVATSGGAGSAAAGGDGDLAGALAAERARWESRHGIEVRLLVLDRPGCDPLAVPVAVAAVGELVANVAKHSGTGLASVSVDTDGRTAVVVVHDEGRGFDPAALTEGTGLSRSVRGRLSAVGGRLELRSAPGEGCDATVALPRP